MSLRLTDDERRTLGGEHGELHRKLLLTVVRFGETMEADRLVEIEGQGHLVIPESAPGLGARLTFLEELAAAGLRTKLPFTADPATLLNDSLVGLTDDQLERLRQAYPDEVRDPGRHLARAPGGLRGSTRPRLSRRRHTWRRAPGRGGRHGADPRARWLIGKSK